MEIVLDISLTCNHKLCRCIFQYLLCTSIPSFTLTSTSNALHCSLVSTVDFHNYRYPSRYMELSCELEEGVVLARSNTE